MLKKAIVALAIAALTQTTRAEIEPISVPEIAQPVEVASTLDPLVNILEIPAITLREFSCLVKNVYYEARKESFLGQVLVAKTTLNRAKHEDFPDDICSVVYQYKQFSWVLDRKRPRNMLEHYFPTVNAAVLAAFNHDSDALFFHATYVKPKWAKQKQRLYKEGNHIFYK